MAECVTLCLPKIQIGLEGLLDWLAYSHQFLWGDERDFVSTMRLEGSDKRKEFDANHREEIVKESGSFLFVFLCLLHSEN